MISASAVKELRERTGAGMMACKKALSEANGDSEKAVEILREKGLAAAAKKAGRVASEGLVVAYVNEDGKSGAIAEVNCETDFVSANEDFKALAENIVKLAAKSNSNTVEELLEENYVDGSSKLKDVITALIAKLGENINLRRFTKFSNENGTIQSYIHGDGRIGVLVNLNADKISDEVHTLAKDICMQIAAANPLYLDETSVDQTALDKEREIYKVQALNEGKPEKIVEKMVEGRIKKYLKEVCLLDQVWVRDSDLTISKLVAKKSKELSAAISIADFVRFERGEGIEKKEENFAEEVQKQMQQSK
ncbi:elongation factor Ts [Clostridium acetobutylicum]|uniref:Elongation factor Ts n=1 Tax=Clostridium acetobutylicum (strain ATCC 824 / DSM 792 / JCM 1419 / IAM 19013 / LMG 5710 / NBRC 13948 / NRRL B-527 / VKM B-1787 / 2291 / W) TaxID=272562 RepID=EFTS_CLOAB|nr:MULTISPECIES: translation elongation factor Ts [Clostridium]Q97I65.1 RecName: Full=Elongation factor Ts; Short=EF-Ts [Clostridium acetobutylicum ATCC 824]AAK79753.1 Translation elongation factor Ts [Clostridium acetobutylicum ATCC 824]ADZ20838.1 elongation factor Ts [Clostridium acetobutylicum EA 2018]AEI33973.1 elongation factor Ts [Clostridium acetobutylicum DSM 1731]AWV79812.1 elongation factor Ts [Clostridium acetobutylicum]MBC2394206.1 elongation factor Ts [Clostridium acetobutylicum]